MISLIIKFNIYIIFILFIYWVLLNNNFQLDDKLKIYFHNNKSNLFFKI